MNFTDVDDKIIIRARETGQDPLALAEHYTERFQRHMVDLNVRPPTETPRVTQTIDEILHMVQTLIDKDYAYESEGDVYFRVLADDDYGKLSRRKLEHAIRSERERFGDDLKEDAADFAVWKGQKAADEPAWPSPWGLGRPGWHIECSAMARQYLGDTIDIHGGGNDLIFPHHENEIAQSESCNAAPLAKYWLHNGMLQLRGEKMSKSLGNMITIDAFLDEHDADVFRLLVLSSHYRKPLAFDDDVVNQSERGLERLRSALRSASGEDESGPAHLALVEGEAQVRQRFQAAMQDDFNSAGALGHLYDFVKIINTARDGGVGGPSFDDAQRTLRALAEVLGLRLQSSREGSADMGPLVDLLIEVRMEMRALKQWAIADRIRDRLGDIGIILEDTRDGTTWRWQG